jgi:hypothetical protein
MGAAFPVWNWSESDLAFNKPANFSSLLTRDDSDYHPAIFPPPFRSAVAFKGPLSSVPESEESLRSNSLTIQFRSRGMVIAICLIT